MKKLTIGIVAHVDAGKTTLSECMLYRAGQLRQMGRVDNGDTFLDTDSLEKKRGITIFSKQARFSYDDMEVCLVDTPGHVDFSTQMEQTLQVLDYAILVISGTDGVQSHTRTVWRLLKRHRVPVFLFINKTDLRGVDKHMLLTGLKKQLSESCISFDPFADKEEWSEEIALQDESVLEHYMQANALETEQIAGLIARRKVFPCYFGSAFKGQGVGEFLKGLSEYTLQKHYPDRFGARVFKITRDEQNNRLTHIKVTGGDLKVKSLLGEEKINQIRLYNGAKYTTVNEAKAGEICALTGLEKTRIGQGFGVEYLEEELLSEPVLEYRIVLPADCDVHAAYRKLSEFMEEDPKLYLSWNEKHKEIRIKLMGEVQTEILKSRMEERLGFPVEFGSGHIVYKETIKSMVEGVGHFEPLRHYAEVHLLLEPLEEGMGLQFATQCSTDKLDLNWQRLILTHLSEREHPGVLTGSAITDMKITVVGGRAHDKHTEGGDFRQATYRAVRQGLKQAQSVLLEPYYRFRMEIPQEMSGRAMTDVQRMYGTCEIAPEEVVEEGFVVLTGSAPVACMKDYPSEVTAYTRGLGRIYCTFKGYGECHNAEEVILEAGYDSETDLDNPTGSVFCSHGAGTYVKWDEVFRYMHVGGFLKDSGSTREEAEVSDAQKQRSVSQTGSLKKTDGMYGSWEQDKELEAIFERTFGKIKRYPASRTGFGYENAKSPEDKRKNIEEAKKVYKESHSALTVKDKEQYVLVDGYNVIFAWDELKELSTISLDAARGRLLDILCNYQGFHKCVLIAVFDAYKVKGKQREVTTYHNIHVVYTKEAETADMYIEKVTRQIGHKEHVMVVTSDGLEQMIVAGHGALRRSAREFLEDVRRMEEQMRDFF
jgi:small GTP-binding protein